MDAEQRAVRFGERWTCQACGLTLDSEWDAWRHLVELHPSDGPGQALGLAIVAAVDAGLAPWGPREVRGGR